MPLLTGSTVAWPSCNNARLIFFRVTFNRGSLIFGFLVTNRFVHVSQLFTRL